MADKKFAKYLMSFEDFISKIDKIEEIEIPKDYIMIEHGYTKEKSKKQKTRDASLEQVHNGHKSNKNCSSNVDKLLL